MRQEKITDNSGKIIYDSADWKAGLAPGGKLGTAVNYKKAITNGFSQITAIDPFAQYGSISSGGAPSANATNASGLAGTLVAFEVKDNTHTYGLDSGGKVHSISYLSIPGEVNASPHTIAGTSPVGQDFVLYRRRSASTPTYTTSLFYSYYNNANWDVGCITDASVAWASATFDDDFMSAVPLTPLDITSGDGDNAEQRTMPHPLCVGADDILYIGSGRYLHAYDGDQDSQGKFYSKVLTLPAGSQIVGLKKFDDKLLIAVNYYSTSSYTGVGQAFVYVWNYQDADVNTLIPLEDNYVSAITIWKGTPTVITTGSYGRNGEVKVKFISGNSLIKVADFNSSTPPIMRGTVPADDVLYMNVGGKLITVGDRYEKNNYGVNHIGTFTTPGVSGGLFYDFGSSLTMWGGTSASTTYTFSALQTATNSSGAGNCRTFSYFPTFPSGKIGKMKRITVEYAQTLNATGTNGTFTLKLYPDNRSAYTIVDAVSSVAVPLTKRYEYTSAGAVLPEFTSFEFYMEWVAGTSGSPIISKVMFEYDLVDIKA